LPAVNLLLVRSHQAEIIVVKCLIQVCKNTTRVEVKTRLYNRDDDRQKNSALTLSSTLLTNSFFL